MYLEELNKIPEIIDEMKDEGKTDEDIRNFFKDNEEELAEIFEGAIKELEEVLDIMKETGESQETIERCQKSLDRIRKKAFYEMMLVHYNM